MIFLKMEKTKDIIAIMKTNKGTLKIKLFWEETPVTCGNFVNLIQRGYYNGLNFHRVIDGFMAQGGCPTGTGTGGPEWAIACETQSPQQVHKKGSLSMAHAGKNTGGSQFFLCFVSCPHLDGGHTVFGGIESSDQESFDVLDNIRQQDTIETIEILSARD